MREMIFLPFEAVLCEKVWLAAAALVLQPP
jgi:hypothetical protein